MNEDESLTPSGAEMVAGLSAFCDALEAGKPIEKRFTIRNIKLDLQPKSYGPDDVKKVRATLNASQALLAKFLGVSVKTIRSWELGLRPVPTMARRYMDEIIAYPDLWNDRLRAALSDDSVAPPADS